MLFCCLWPNVEASCHKHFVVVSRHQQRTPPLTTSDKYHNLRGFRRNIAMPFCVVKREWFGYPSVKSFFRAMLCISAAYSVMRCLSVCVSVTFVSCVKTNKHIFKKIFTIGYYSHAILVCSCQTA